MTKFSVMILTFSTLGLLLPLHSSGLHLPFERRAPRGVRMTSPRSATRYSFSSSSKETLDNKYDVRYAANITINGRQVPVALDTGSTDLWVNPRGGIGNFNDTQIPISVAYGDGSYGVTGTIGVAPLKLGAYEVPRQAFVNVTRSTFRGLSEYGLWGMLGLGLDSTTASKIKATIQQRYGASATWGKSVLFNIFEQYPSLPNLVAMRLSRTADLEDTKGGSYFIGEYDPDYRNVTNSPKLAQFPEGANRWTTLLEGAYVGGKSIPLRPRLRGVPSGHALPMLDTGVPTTLLTSDVWNAIYAGIPGAVKYSPTLWLVPCNATTIVEFAFGGVRYPMHPLDLTNISAPYAVNGRQYISCVSALNILQESWVENGFEMLLGDSFLRNVYSVFNFGDASSSSKPYMQLLSTTDPSKAVAQVATIRRRTLADLPAELPPAEAVRLREASTTGSADDAQPSSSTDSESKDLANADTTGLRGSEEQPLYTSLAGIDFKTYGIVALSLLGANVFIGLALLVFAVFACVRRGSARRGAQQSTSHYVPVKLQDEGSYPARYDSK